MSADAGDDHGDRGDDVRAIQAFFAPRAAGWEDRFPDDGPAYRGAVADLEPNPAGVALDAGCGTGRALEFLRDSIGPGGLVIGLDATPEMLAEALRRGRSTPGSVVLVLGDARRLPLTDGSVDTVLAAGLVPHMDEVSDGLAELARVTRPGGRLAVFHPISRTALAARHGRLPSDDDAMAPARLVPAVAKSGWQVLSVDDGDDRFLLLALRR